MFQKLFLFIFYSLIFLFVLISLPLSHFPLCSGVNILFSVLSIYIYSYKICICVFVYFEFISHSVSVFTQPYFIKNPQVPMGTPAASHCCIAHDHPPDFTSILPVETLTPPPSFLSPPTLQHTHVPSGPEWEAPWTYSRAELLRHRAHVPSTGLSARTLLQNGCTRPHSWQQSLGAPVPLPQPCPVLSTSQLCCQSSEYTSVLISFFFPLL